MAEKFARWRTAEVLLADLADGGPRCVRRAGLEIGAAGSIFGSTTPGSTRSPARPPRWSFEQKLAALWRVDVRGHRCGCRAAVGQRMKQRGSGAIINIGWDQSRDGHGRRQRRIVCRREGGRRGVHAQPGSIAGAGKCG